MRQMQRRGFTLVELTEPVEVLGKSIQADVFTWKTSAEAGPVSNKLWMSNEIPGRVIKHQTEVAGNKTEEVMTGMSVPEHEPTR